MNSITSTEKDLPTLSTCIDSLMSNTKTPQEVRFFIDNLEIYIQYICSTNNLDIQEILGENYILEKVISGNLLDFKTLLQTSLFLKKKENKKSSYVAYKKLIQFIQELNRKESNTPNKDILIQIKSFGQTLKNELVLNVDILYNSNSLLLKKESKNLSFKSKIIRFFLNLVSPYETKLKEIYLFIYGLYITQED